MGNKTCFILSRYCRPLPNKSHEDDEVKDLRILKLMSKKCYIFSCYEAVVEANLNDSGEINDCKCHNLTSEVDGEANKNDTLETYISMVVPFMDNEEHHCAAHEDFVPELFCNDHIECNEPIFRLVDDLEKQMVNSILNIAYPCKGCSCEA